VLNNALMTARGTHSFHEALADHSRWGRLVESAVGAHLLNTADRETQVHYWREASFEVDFVVEHRGRLAAIEVKSQAASRLDGSQHRGLAEFCSRYPQAKRWLVGSAELPLAEFFMKSAAEWAR
jgi:uncharacterized protein